MTVQERILTLLLLEKIKENPEHAKRIGIEIKEKKEEEEN